MPPTYTLQWLGAVAVTVILAMLGAIQIAGPNIGLDDHVKAWIGIGATGLGVLNSVLPRVQVPPGSPPSPH